MKRKLASLCLLAVLAFTVALPVHAQAPEKKEPYTEYGNPGWNVTFTDKQKMENNFKTADMNDAVSKLQPGDRIIFTVNLRNEDSNATDWYMTNKVLDSLEASTGAGANGGAYTYRLVYHGPGGENILFDSEKIGGDEVSDGAAARQAAGAKGREGLEEATAALEEYFILDTLNKGQSGTITLTVGLEGESQGNAYQNTFADLTMNFAVERRPSPANIVREPKQITLVRADTVRTGDDSQLLFYTALFLTSGMMLLLLSLYVRKEMKEEG